MSNNVELRTVIELAGIYRINWETKTFQELSEIILRRSKCCTLAEVARKNSTFLNTPGAQYHLMKVIPGGKSED